MDRRGISEVAGTMVLIGVVVVGMMIVNLVIFSTPTNTRIPSLQASMTNRSTFITIVHQGGDSIPAGQYQILVDGVDQTGNFTSSGSPAWSLGKTLSYNTAEHGFPMPQKAVMIYNGTGKGGIVILETRFPWGVYVPPIPHGSGGSGDGGLGSPITPTPTPTPTFSWYDCNWSYRKNITIDHNRVPVTQTYFPVLISLDPATSGLSGKAQGDGDDILFTKEDGLTKIPHEIESYSSGTLVAWVNVSSVSSTTNTTIMMYYGNLGASNQQDKNNVWDTNYKAVWHLNDGGTGTRYDSTSNANNLNPRNYTGSEATTGQISGADYLHNGTPPKDWLESTNNIGITGNAVRTITFWSELDTTLRCGMVGWGSNVANREFSPGVRGNGYFLWGYSNDWGPITTALTGSWHYYAVIHDGTTVRWYMDLSQLGSGYTHTYNTADSHVFLGHEEDMGSWNTWMQGTIDEVRVSSTNRPLSRIATEYNNTYSPSTFYSVGSQVPSPCSVTPTPTTTPTPAPWYDCSWQERKRITIDHTMVNGTQSDFPVLVSIASDSGLQANAKSSGDDIFFTAADGTTKLSHEIESYSSGTLAAWVKVPSISSVSDTFIYMYYGNPSSPSQQDKNGVWTNGFTGVWHLKETTGGSMAIKDSTSNGNHGTDSGSPVLGTTGKIGNAISFDGDNERIVIPDPGTGSVLDFGTGSSITLSAWFKPDTLGGFRSIMLKGDTNVGPNNLNYGLQSNGSTFTPNYYGGSADYDNYQTTGNVFATGKWYYGVWTYTFGSAGSAKIYINGSLQSAWWITGNGNEAPYQNNLELWFGDSVSDEQWSGILDEERISNTIRSAEWIATEYANQNNPSTFFSLAGEESAPCTPPTTVPTTPTTAPTPSPPWFNCYWPYRKNITINKTAVSGTQTNFPVLVSLASDTDLKNHARSDGYDILFTREDGQTEIFYEREYYNNANGALTAWVKVPQIQNSANTTIYMYYGFLSSPDKSKPPNVWDANYKAVWHLNESGSGVAGEFTDSTSGNVNNGKGGGGVANPTLTQTGVADGAQIFDGTGLDYIGMGTSGTLQPSTLTFSFWINRTASWNGQLRRYFYAKGASETGNGWYIDMSNIPGTGDFPINLVVNGDNGFHGPQVAIDTFYPQYKWTYMVITFSPGNPGTYQVYKNGISQTPYNYYNSPNSISTTSDTKYLGITPVTGPNITAAVFDEIRVSNNIRTSSWIATEYNNQANPALFHYIGPEESFFCGGTSGPSYVQSRSLHFEYVNQASITLPGSTTAGNLLVLSCVINQSNSVATVTDSKNGNAYNWVQTTNVGTWGKVYTYNVPNSLGGTGPITATVSLQSPANKTFDVFFLEYSGVASTSPVDVFSSGSASSGTAMNSGDKPITNAPSLIYGFGAGNSSCHAATPYTDRETANGRCAVDRTVFMTGTFNVTATQAISGNWALQMVAFKGA